MNILFLYHDPCTDGFLCRIIAQLYYSTLKAHDVTYAGVNPSCLLADLEKILQDKTFDQILMFDVSLTAETYTKLCEHSQHVEVFDHHESTLKAFGDVQTPWLTFDNSKCGSHLAFRYYFGNYFSLPMIVQYVEIRDLWLFGTTRDLPNSKEITTALYTYWFRVPFRAPETYYFLLFNTPDDFWADCTEKGKILLEQTDAAVNAIVANMKQKTVSTLGHDKQVLVGNSAEYISEVGNKIAQSCPTVDFSILWCFDSENRIKISLRSDAKRCNVNDVAKELWKGGGHAAAAGALITDELEKENFLKQFNA